VGLVTARDGIASAIDSIGGLSVFDHVSDQVSETPAVVMRLSGPNYTDQTFTFSLLLITSGFEMSETEPGLHPYLDSVGSNSIKVALDTYAGCTVVSSTGIERRKFGGIEHLVAESKGGDLCCLM